jgi:hypothetical protein
MRWLPGRGLEASDEGSDGRSAWVASAQRMSLSTTAFTIFQSAFWSSNLVSDFSPLGELDGAYFKAMNPA